MKTIWLSSYPKSGNTWISSFLYYYFFGVPKNLSEIMSKIPDIHELGANNQKLDENSDHNVICKSHFLYSNAHPHIKATSGFIYLMRHPKDILLSTLNFYKLLSPDSDFDEYQYSSFFIENAGDMNWVNLGFGRWPNHFESWKNAANSHPSLFVKYEDLRIDPQKFRTLIQFISQDEINEAHFQTAMDLTSFESMRKLEIQEKQENMANAFFPGNNASLKSGHLFVNKGAIGQNLSHIGPDLDERFEEKFSDILSIMGY